VKEKLLVGKGVQVLKQAHVVWKKAYLLVDDSEECLVKLRLPAGTRVMGFELDTRYNPDQPLAKWRADQAEVLGIYALNGKTRLEDPIAVADWDSRFCYPVDGVVTPLPEFSTSSYDDCHPGIHFFTTAADAAKWII
jgi:hypothetical protein